MEQNMENRRGVTLRQIAEETGKSRRTVQRYAQQIPESEKRTIHDGTITRIELTEAGAEQLRQILHDTATPDSDRHGERQDARQENGDNTATNSTPDSDRREDTTAQLVAVLREQLAAKDEQIAAMQRTIDGLQATIQTQAESLKADAAARLALNVQPEQGEEPAPEPELRPGFFKRLFHRKKESEA